MTPWASAIQRQREARNHVDDPYGYCLPPGTPRINFGGGPFRILQTPQVTAFLYETVASMIFRQVYTDGRTLPSPASRRGLGIPSAGGKTTRSSSRRPAFETAGGSIRA